MRQGRRNLILAGLCAAIVCALAPASASAGTITPNALGDDFGNPGSCSLREAIEAANTDGDFGGCTAVGAMVDEDEDTIVLQSGSTYGLTLTPFPLGVDDTNETGDLDVRFEDLIIQSSGAARATIDANGITTADRVLDLGPNSQFLASASLTNLVITDGIDSAGAGGAGIRNGGASSLTITNSRITANSSPAGAGGALRQSAGGAVTITDTSIDTNNSGAGGGIFHELGTLNLTRSTVSGNQTPDALSGGGGLLVSQFAHATLRNTTVSGNMTKGNGGGIWSQGTLTLANTTVAENGADTDDTGGGDGGGLYANAAGTVTARSSIFSDNADNSSVGNVFNDCGIVAPAVLVSQGFNIVEDGAGCVNWVASDLVGSSADIGPLADNGGPTRTHLPQPGGDAVDAGNPATPGGAAPACELLDQRAQPRAGAPEPCDIGAVEVQGVVFTLNKTGAGAGSVVSDPAGINCGGTCNAVFDEGTELTLTATADAGSTFAGWSNPGCGTLPCDITVGLTQNAMTATFNDIAEPPVLDPIGDKTVQTGQNLAFAVTATDPDPGAVLTYSMLNGPAGATLNPTTGAFSWTPSAAQVGTFPAVEFIVSDGTLADSELITITVTPAPAGGGGGTGGGGGAVTPGPTGRRAAALKKCKRKKGVARKKCKKKAKKLPA